MPRNIFLIPFLLLSQEVLANDEYPTNGRVFNLSEDSKLEYRCKLNKDLLSCEFTQISLRQRSDKEASEKQIKEAMEEFDKNGDRERKKICSEIGLFDKYLKQEGHKLPYRRAQSFSNQLILIKNYCANPSRANYEKIIRHGEEAATKTCYIDVNSYSQNYKRNSSGNWLVVSTPDETCGRIRLDRFEQEKSKTGNWVNWNHVTRQVITNKTGTRLFGFSCSQYDEQEYKWDWRRQQLKKDCDFIDLE